MSGEIWKLHECIDGVITCCDIIVEGCKSHDRKTLASERLLYRGLLYSISCIGWAVHSMPRSVCDLYPDIDWDFIMLLGYAIDRSEVNWKIDSEAVWFFIDDIIPKLLPIMKKIKDSWPQEDKDS